MCAVKINLHELLIDNRKESVEDGYTSLAEKAAWKIWRMACQSRMMMNMGNGKFKNKVVNGIAKDWTRNRADLNFSKKTFNQMWKDRMK